MRRTQEPNSDTVDTTIVDPLLNDDGIEHCKARCAHLQCANKHITHILSSPLSRGLQTSWLTFADAVSRGVKIYAIPELQSLGCGPNSIGLDHEELIDRWLAHGANFEYMIEHRNAEEQKRSIRWHRQTWRTNTLKTIVADPSNLVRNATPQVGLSSHLRATRAS
ncbi:hypothetical protein DL98DRAFT_579816 [Cadophora sp. DSE1049]|nr:hypothetical protein DL98DRAFT_579816 [Cadophora sp. DSE1049]